MKRYAFPLTIILLLFAVIALAAPGDKRPAVTSAAIGLGTSSSPTLASVTATTSVTAPAYNSTAADGYHYVLPYNSVVFAGTPSVGMIQTTPTGPQWYTGSAWEAIGSGGGGTWGSITGTLSAQTDLQTALNAKASTSYVDTAIAGVTAGTIPFVSDTTPPSAENTINYSRSDHKFRFRYPNGDVYVSAAMTLETAADTTPAAFAFTDETDVVADGGQSCGAAITVSGTNYPSSISTTGDTGYGYKINGGTFTSASGMVTLNDTVAPCVNRSNSNSTATTATITIGGVSDVYSVTTAAGESLAPEISGATYAAVAPSGYTYSSEETTRYGTYKYNTLAAALTARARDLTSESGPQVFDIIGDWTGIEDGSTQPVVSGYTTDATHGIVIRTFGDARHSGAWSTSAYRIIRTTTATNGAVRVAESYVTVDGLQIQVSGNSSTSFGFDNGADHITIKNNIMRGDSTTAGQSAIALAEIKTDMNVINNIAYDYETANTGTRVFSVGSYTASVVRFYNNTVVGGYMGFYANAATSSVILANNVSMGNPRPYSERSYYTNAGNTNNASDDTNATTYSAPGSNPVSLTGAVTDYFVSATDYHLKSGTNALVDAGTDLSGTFTADIDGTTRTGTWDIGADER